MVKYNKLVKLKGLVFRETEPDMLFNGAILFSVDEGKTKKWVPKFVIYPRGINFGVRQQIYEISIPYWLAKKQRLIR